MHIIMGYLVGITPKHTLCFWYAHAVSLARGFARSDMLAHAGYTAGVGSAVSYNSSTGEQLPVFFF